MGHFRVFLFKRFISQALLILIIFSIGAGAGYSYIAKSPPSLQASQEKNTHKAFLSESYDKILKNYWDNISEVSLIDLYKITAEKSIGTPLPLRIESKDKLLELLENHLKSLDNKQKSEFTKNLVTTVLSNLSPQGRSGLFTTKQEEALKNTVENINPDKDLYKDLGLTKGASQSAVNEAFQKKAEELKYDQSLDAANKLKQISYAKDVLTSKDKKENYDQKGVEPTIFTKVIKPTILYLQFKKFSPTTYEEFQKAFDSYKDNANISALIFDLRGNVGGAIDATPYFLGHFIGKNQYAFDFYHKGEYLPFKTPTDKLPSIQKFKQVVILVDNQTQSSAEIMAASLKKYHAGVVIGVPTKGWGTVERVFPLDNQFDKGEKYSMFLVHSITLRDDNQPIEGRGVEPNVNIKDPNWEQQLFSYFRNAELTSALKEVISNLD